MGLRGCHECKSCCDIDKYIESEPNDLNEIKVASRGIARGAREASNASLPHKKIHSFYRFTVLDSAVTFFHSSR